VGTPVGWDQRLQMSDQSLGDLLSGDSLSLYVLRDAGGLAVGLAEFDTSGHPDVELKNFGVVPEVQGRGLGSWLLATALHREWQAGARRIWLHTDTWDHPAAIHLYRRAGFELVLERDEPAGPL
jgi:ribosomal protein S18 acetylase RimI-like enzyme